MASCLSPIANCCVLICGVTQEPADVAAVVVVVAAAGAAAAAGCMQPGGEAGS